jgi:CBS domain-containing protein
MKIKCPSCGFQNIEGEDRCAQCLHTLHQRDIPLPKKNDTIQTVLLTAPISDLLTGADLLVASPEDTIQKIVKIFQEQKKNCVLVYKKKKLVGILSNRDILWRVTGKYQDLSKVKVEDVMTRNPEWVRASDPISFVVNKMAMGGFRHVPVLDDDGAPLSIILIKDVLAYLASREHSK